MLGTLDLVQVRAALDARVGGGATNDPTAPSKGPGDKDPNEPAFTVRVIVTDAQGNRGEDRKVLFAYRDGTLHQGYPQNRISGGEESQRLFDLNGDNKLENVMADSSGELHVLEQDGTPLGSFNGGQPVRTQAYPNFHPGAPFAASLETPREVLRTPGIGDIDGDLEPEIVDSAGERVYAWNADGSVVPGFPVRLDPALSLPQDRTRNNHIKRGFVASPTLGDLDDDGDLEIVVPGLDQHVYAWDGSGNPLAGFPRKLQDPGIPGAEIINTAALGDITGDGRPDIVSPTAEFDDNPSAPATPGGGAVGGFSNFLTNVLANALGGSGRVYALDRNGSVLPGWPTKPNGIVPDALPFVGPGVDHVLGNIDSDPELEVIGNVASGDVTATNSNGANAVQYDSEPATGEHVDKSKVINLFENPIVADLDGLPGPEVIKGGVTLNQVVNLGVAVGQNLPYNHVVQAWNGQTGASLPTFPQAVEDYQLLSSPAVADASDAPGKEIIVGTGLYYLRNISTTGIEGTNWPKFTGGWIFATPATGDIDADGDLEVAVTTREGYAFMWDTGQPACGGNDEWWTSRHDEWNTGAYGTDTRPPGSPTGLTGTASFGSVELRWMSPGDDWLCGQASRYRILQSDNPIVHPADGQVIGDFDATGGPGETEVRTVSGSGPFFAVMYQDDAGNWGHLRSVQVDGMDGYARPKSATPIYTPLVPAYQPCASPNRTHAQPLNYGSCNPPLAQSPFLTVGTPDSNGEVARSVGAVRWVVQPGNPSTPADEADVRLNLDLTDVRRTADLSDYTGDLNTRVTLQVTDRRSGDGADESGTVMPFEFAFTTACAATADPGTGATCTTATTAEAVIPGRGDGGRPGDLGDGTRLRGRRRSRRGRRHDGQQPPVPDPGRVRAVRPWPASRR